MEETLWNSLISNGGVVIKQQSNDSQDGAILQEFMVKQEEELIIDDPIQIEEEIPERSDTPVTDVRQYPSTSQQNLEENDSLHLKVRKPKTTDLTEESDRRLFTNLLTSWNIRKEIIKHLLDLDFKVNDLKIMTAEDITDLFSKVDIVARIRFRDGVTKLKQFGVEYFGLDTLEVYAPACAEQQANDQNSLQRRTNLRELEAIEHLLVQTLRGKQVLKHYKKYKSLSVQHHKIITDIVVDCLINRRDRLKCSDFKIWAERIVTAFPSERRDIFFIKGSKGRHRGKLVDRYYNVLKKLRKKGLREVTRKPKPTLDKLEEQNPNEIIRLELLTCNDWSRVLKCWKETFNYRSEMNRQKSLMEIGNYWPNYNDQRGAELIEIDYNLLFPDTSKNNLLEDWNKYTDKWKYLMTVNTLENPNDVFYVRLMGKSLPENTNNYLIFMLLHTILPPICMIDHVAIKRKVWQPSVFDSQNSVIVHVLTSKSNITRKINEIKTTYLKYGLDMHPFIVIIGSDVCSYSESYVYVNDFLHKTDSFLKSLDLCFKIYKTFHLDFPKESFLVWQLIERLFYTPGQCVMDPSVTQVLLFLNKTL